MANYYTSNTAYYKIKYALIDSKIFENKVKDIKRESIFKRKRDILLQI